MYFCVDLNHELAKKDAVCLRDIDGLTMTVVPDNCWTDYFKKHLPHSRFLLYSDAVGLFRLLGNPGYFGFSSEVAQEYNPVVNGKKIPILDAETTFHMNYLTEKQSRLQPLLDLFCPPAG